MARLQNHISPVDSDRVSQAILDYEKDYAQSKIYSPFHTSREDIELKLGHYSHLYSAFRKTAIGQEKESLKFLRYEIGRLKAQLNPNFFNRIYYSEFADFLREYFGPKNNPIHHFQLEILKIEKMTVQEHNLQTLNSSLKSVGFNIEVEGQLWKMINQDFPQFHFRYSDPKIPGSHFVLHFRKEPQTGFYYFEKFDAIKLVSIDAVINKDMNCPRQTFPVYGEISINAMEASRLVNGKSICKPIDSNETWLSLDQRQINIGNPYQYNLFDLEKELTRLPILENQSPVKYRDIIQTLKSGGKKEVTLTIDDVPMKYFIEAAPQRKSVDVLDKNNRLVDANKLLKGQTRKIAKQVAARANQQNDQSVNMGEIKIKGMSI